MTVATGRALVGLVPLSTRTWNAVYRGEVLLEDGATVRGFIKDLDPRQLANELLAAVLGTRLGVRVPGAALVAVGNDASTAFTKIPHANGRDYVAFCSVDAGGSTVAQIISSPDQIASLTTLKASPSLGSMYGFDSWIANIDRHANNIVLSGDGSAYLIDHGHCFSGPNWKAADLNSTQVYTNRLRSWLTPRLSVDERNGAMADAAKLVKRMVATDVEDAINAALVKGLYDDSDCDALVGFLEGRVEHVETMSATALDVLL